MSDVVLGRILTGVGNECGITGEIYTQTYLSGKAVFTGPIAQFAITFSPSGLDYVSFLFDIFEPS